MLYQIHGQPRRRNSAYILIVILFVIGLMTGLLGLLIANLESSKNITTYKLHKTLVAMQAQSLIGLSATLLQNRLELQSWDALEPLNVDAVSFTKNGNQLISTSTIKIGGVSLVFLSNI